MHGLLLALLLLCAHRTHTAAASTATALPPLLITAPPLAATVLAEPSLPPFQPPLALDAALNRVPGLFAQNSQNFAQDQRLAIRGFGTRAAFGIREIKLLVDGLPETSPDGQTEIDAIDLGTVQRIEVIRGPAAARFGNAAGGVIRLETASAPATPTATGAAMAGDDGLRLFRAGAGARTENGQHLLNASHLRLDGYRDHSATESTLAAGKLRQATGPASDLTVLFNYVDSPRADDPGALTAAQVAQDRRQARDLNVALDAGEEVRQGKLGLVHHSAADDRSLTLSTYGLLRSLDNRLPILPAAGGGIVALDRDGLGASALYETASQPAGFPNRFLAGLDAQFQDDDRRRFNNEAGTRGTLRFDQRERVTGSGAFIRDELDISETWQANAGARADRVAFDVDDRFRDDGDDSGDRTFDAVSPGGGLRYIPFTDLQLYANAATAFQVPTTTELANPDESGGLNPDLEPQTAVTFETGLRAALPGRITADIAIFESRIEDELIPFEGTSGRTFYRNAGKSRRRGVELALDGEVARDWRWALAYTHLDAELTDYNTDAGDFSGNTEAGIPANQCFAELAYGTAAGFAATVNALYVDEFFTDDANAAQNDACTVVNAQASYAIPVGRARLTPFAGVNNLTDAHYNGLIRLNAAGARYFEPAPDLSAYGGVMLACEL